MNTMISIHELAESPEIRFSRKLPYSSLSTRHLYLLPKPMEPIVSEYLETGAMIVSNPNIYLYRIVWELAY
jgi:hypothetical protein